MKNIILLLALIFVSFKSFSQEYPYRLIEKHQGVVLGVSDFMSAEEMKAHKEARKKTYPENLEFAPEFIEEDHSVAHAAKEKEKKDKKDKEAAASADARALDFSKTKTTKELTDSMKVLVELLKAKGVL